MKHRKRMLLAGLVFVFAIAFGLYIQPAQPVMAETGRPSILPSTDPVTTTNPAELVQNPYLTNSQFQMFTKSELVMTEVNSDRATSQRIYHYQQGDPVNSKSEQDRFMNSSKYDMVNSVAFDPNHTGRKDHIATLIYGRHREELWLTVTNADGNGLVSEIRVSDFATSLKKVPNYAAFAFMGITAGDYDGDGRDTIVVYSTASKAIYEYELSSGVLQYTNRSITTRDFVEPGAWDATNRGKGTDRLRNTPVLQMTSDDVDKDQKDELIIAAGFNDTANDIRNSGSYLNIYDYDGAWKRTFQVALSPSHDSASAGRLRWAGVTVGNIIQNVRGVDYPEIIVAGYRDSASGDGDSIVNDKFAVYAYAYNGGQYGELFGDSIQNLNGFTKGGLYTGDDFHNPMCIKAFAGRGRGIADLLFIEGNVYAYDGNLQFIDARDPYFKEDDNGVGGYIISNTDVTTAAVGNFDGNKDGREQVVFMTALKQQSFDKYFHNKWIYQFTEPLKKDNNGNIIGSITDTSSFASHDYSWQSYHVSSGSVALAAGDFGVKDGIVAKVKNKTTAYSKPKIFAFLQSPPYFKELSADIGNGGTDYGESKGSSSGSSYTSHVSSGIVVDVSFGIPILGSMEWETEATFEWSKESVDSVTKETNITWSNDTGENAVIVGNAPVTTYEYDIWDYTAGNGQATPGSMYIGFVGLPTTVMMNVNDFNIEAKKYGLQQIDESNSGLMPEAGDPRTYPRGAVVEDLSGKLSSKYKNDELDKMLKRYSAADEKTLFHRATWVSPQTIRWGDQAIGTVEISTSTSREHEVTQSYGFNLDTSITREGKILSATVKGGVKIGGGFDKASITVDSTGVSKTGRVSSRPNLPNAQNYNFDWKFGIWPTAYEGELVPVLGYVVDSISAPPSVPDNLAIAETSSHEMTLRWESGKYVGDKYYIYRYNPNDFNHPYVRLGMANDSNKENGEYNFTVKGLNPNKNYQFVVTAAQKDDLESAYSDPVSGTTVDESIKPVTFTSPKDKIVAPGSTATFSVTGIDKGGYNQLSYQWQSKKQGGHFQDILDPSAQKSSYTISNVDQNTHNDTQYRCIVRALTTDGESYPFYSSAATLKVDANYAFPQLTITGAEKGKGSQNEPYQGMASYNKLQTSTSKVDRVENVYVTYQENRYPVYAAKSNTGEEKYFIQVVSWREVDVPEDYPPDKPKPRPIPEYTYYGVSKEDSGDYIVGEEIAVAQTTVFKKGEETINFTQKPLTVKLGEKTYSKYLFIKDTNQDERAYTASMPQDNDHIYISEDGITFYVFSEKMDKLPEKSISLPSGVDAALLYSEASDNQTTTYQVSVQKGALLLELKKAKQVSPEHSGDIALTTSEIKEVPQNKYTFKDGEMIDPDIETVQKTVTVDQITSEMVAQPGQEVKFNVGVFKDEDLSIAHSNYDKPIAVRVRNLSNSVDDTLQVTKGKAGYSYAWTPSAKGLYAITAMIDDNESQTYYYLAKDDSETANVLNTKVGGNNVFAIDYGTTVELSVDKINLNDAEKTPLTENISYKYFDEKNGLDQGKIIDGQTVRLNAGTYIIKAYEQDKEIASTKLEVRQIPIELVPTWEGKDKGAVPARLNAVEASVSTSTKEQYKEIFGDLVNSYEAYVSDDHPNSLYDNNGNLINDAVGSAYISLKPKDDADKAKLANFKIEKPSVFVYVNEKEAKVTFGAGENGTLNANYGDGLETIVSGESKAINKSLQFRAVPNAGFKVSQWTVDGETLTPGRLTLDQEKQYELQGENGEILIIKNFTKDVDVKVTFRNVQHRIEFSVKDDDTSKLTATLNNGASSIKTGEKVADSSSVTFTADIGKKAVAKWVVNGSEYKWPNSKDLYREKTLTLDKVTKDTTVELYVTEAQPAQFKLTTATVTAEGSGEVPTVNVKVFNKATGAEVTDLNNIPEGTALTLKLDPAEGNYAVQEWQIDKNNGNGFETIKGSGAQKSIDLLNITGNWSVKALIATAQNYTLAFNVVGAEEGQVTMTAESNGKPVESGSAQPAYVPVAFHVDLPEGYYITAWSENVTQNEEDSTTAELASLNKNTTVTVTVEKKPQLTIDATDNGSIEVFELDADGQLQGNALETGAFLDPAKTYRVVAKPGTGFEVNQVTINEGQSDGTSVGENTDDKYVDIPNPSTNQAVDATFAEIPQYDFNLEIIAGSEQYGNVSYNITRKNMDDYNQENVGIGSKQVYRDSVITFNVDPNDGYMASPWVVDEKEQLIAPAGMEIKGPHNVRVRFNPIGNKATFGFDASDIKNDDHGGSMSAMFTANNGDGQSVEFVNGNNFTVDGTFVVKVSDLNVKYVIEGWYLNGAPQGENENTFETAVQPGQGVNILAKLTRQSYPVYFSGKNANVSAKLSGAPALAGDVANGQMVKGDSSVEFTATSTQPNGYKFDGWTINGQKQKGTDTTITLAITEETTVSAEYVLDTEAQYDVTYSVKSGDGNLTTTASERSPAQVKAGGNISFTAQPAEDHRIKAWYVDGQEVQGNRSTTYRLDNVLKATKVEVEFETIPIFTISIEKPNDVEGSIEAKLNGNPVSIDTGRLTVRDTDVLELKAIPTKGHSLTQWKKNQAKVSDSLTYTMTGKDFEGNPSIEAEFKAVETVDFKTTQKEGGTIAAKQTYADKLDFALGDTTTTAIILEKGSKVTVTATPDAQKMVKQWLINDKPVENNLTNTLVIDSLQSATTVAAEFEDLVLYAVDLGEANGLVEVKNVKRAQTDYGDDSPLQVRKNGDVSFDIYPASGKAVVLSSVTLAGATVTKNDDGSFHVEVKNVTDTVQPTIDAKEGIKLAALPNVENGSVAITRGGKAIKAGDIILPGDELTIKVTANRGFKLNEDSVQVNGVAYKNGEPYTVTGNLEELKEKGIQVTASFEKDNTPAPSGGGGGGGFIPPAMLGQHGIIIDKLVDGKITADPSSAKEGQVVKLKVEPADGKVLDQLTVKTADGKDIAVKNDNGTYSFTMPGKEVKVSATFKDAGAVQPPTDGPFVDVSSKDWFFDDVKKILDRGLMKGVSDTEFAPHATTTRGMIVAILYRLENEPAVEDKASFEDVEDNMWYTDAINWAAKNDIVHGYSETTFAPNEPISREQMAAIMYNYAKFKTYNVEKSNDLNAYADKEQINAYALEALQWANAEGLVQGMSTTEIAPQGEATRAQVAAIINRFYDKFVDVDKQ